MAKTREVVHKEAEEAFFSSLPLKKSVIMGTGTGKSRLAINILNRIDEDFERLQPGDILLLTSSEPLRDVNWEHEFKKFGATDLWSYVVSECYQTAYRWRDKHFKVIIADEVDFALTEKYIAALTENKCDYFLGLTGFCTEEKRELLDGIAPVCFEYHTQDAQEDGVLNKTKFLLVEFELSDERSVVVKKKDGTTFSQSESAAYKYWESEFQKNVIAKSVVEKKRVSLSLLGRDTSELDKTVRALDWKIKKAYTKRRELLLNLKSSRDVAKSLLSKILQDDNNRVIVFSEFTNQIDQICAYTYYGNERTEPDKMANLDKFIRGEIHSLGVCKKINRGINARVTHIIKESFQGSETDFQQQHGRGMRLDPGETLCFIVLLPYYRDYAMVPEVDPKTGLKVAKRKLMRLPTQSVKWFREMTASFDLSNSRTIEMDEYYRLPEGEELK